MCSGGKMQNTTAHRRTIVKIKKPVEVPIYCRPNIVAKYNNSIS
jgi:hypothetical protein